MPCLGFFKKEAEKASPFDEVDYHGGQGDGPDSIALLDTAVQGLGFRLEMFDAVSRSLDIVCHTIHAGASTDAFFSGIARAAERGVKVRILFDGKANVIRPSVLSLMRVLSTHPNIACKQYNPMHPLKPWRWHFLMHDKYILGDDRYLLLGGRNIGDKFFAPDQCKGKFSNDRDVVVVRTADAPYGRSVVSQAQAYFDEMWETSDSKPVIQRRGSSRHGEGVLKALHARAGAFIERNPAYRAATFDAFLSRAQPTRRITFLHNPPDVCHKAPWIWRQLLRIAMDAHDSVVFQTPYITGNQGILSAFHSISERVSLSILTNSAASTPNYPAYSNYVAHRNKFMRTGARIHEYQSRHSIHGKAMVVDGQLGIIGSFNLDDRSMHLDTEVMLVVDSAAFAGKLTESIDAYMAQSLCVNAQGEDATFGGGVRVPVPAYKMPLLRFVSVFSLMLRSFI